VRFYHRLGRHYSEVIVIVENENDNTRLALVLDPLGDDLTIRTLPKVRIHLNLALVVILVGAWAMVSRQKLQRTRQIVHLAA